MLRRLLTYIDDHICEKISLVEMAELAGYSPFYFSKLFAEIMGMPITGYIPDGNGVWYQEKTLEQYAPCCNDDDLVLFMSEKI